MRLGDEVPGILCDGWRFVAEDLHNICGRVQKVHPESRLVFKPETNQYGIAVWFKREDMSYDDARHHDDLLAQARDGIWFLALGIPFTCEGEPDARIVEYIQKIDNQRQANSWVHDPKRVVAYLKERQRQREEKWLNQVRDSMGDPAERIAYRTRRELVGPMPRIAVPKALDG